MTTKVDIANNALNMIGEESITSFEERRPNARRIKSLYDTSRLAVLRLHPFNCATKRIQLTPLKTKPSFGYSNQFQLPDDMVRIIDTGIEDYTVEGSKLLADSDVLNLIYVFDQKNEEEFDSLFQECLILYLAYKIAKGITGSQNTSDIYFQQFNLLLTEAKAIQAQEKPSQQFADDADFILLRR